MMRRSTRRVNNKLIPPDLILIVTEGEKTEPLYFKSFPLHTTKVARIVGTGTNTISLIKETDKEVQKAIDGYEREYSVRLKTRDIVVWCVFDKDSFTASHFDNAIISARAKGYQVANSNEAFELWYLLHYHYFNTGITRDQYKAKLTDLLGKHYEKNDPDMYKTLLSKQADAIRNAKNLMALYNPVNPNKDNPSTTVYELVEYLNQFLSK